jgi:N-carbamoyl-L-amino-acid hydrolase
MEREANLIVRIDAVGNLIGRRQGKKQKPAILIGSHIDTVREGGRFDGTSGVIAGIEIARRFEEEGVENIHPLEVVSFLAEEPSPFGISTVGSRGMVGELSEELLTSLKDDQGRTLGAAIEEMGGDPARIREAQRSSDDILAYLELHAEQGPQLFSKGIPIGVVTGIAGILRGDITVVGRNDHAGTMPMESRKDALVAASKVVLALEEVCKNLEGVVGTVGRIEAFPNALNVIPGRVTLGMEVRSLEEALLGEAASLLGKQLDLIGEERGVRIDSDMKISSRPVMFDTEMVQRIGEICERLGIPRLVMPSGAGHDAAHIAEIAPAGMIFFPSREGRSHCPEEWSEFNHIALGIEVLANTFTEMDKEGAH